MRFLGYLFFGSQVLLCSLHDQVMTCVFSFSFTGQENAPKICYKCKKAGHLSRDCREHTEKSSVDQRNGKLENPDGGTGISASEMEQIAMEDDDIHEIGEEEKGKLKDVDYLTGNPLPSDVLLYAVPVCGPYTALQSYKYRVKIVPGTAKKGKGIFVKTTIILLSFLWYESTDRFMHVCLFV